MNSAFESATTAAQHGLYLLQDARHITDPALADRTAKLALDLLAHAAATYPSPVPVNGEPGKLVDNHPGSAGELADVGGNVPVPLDGDRQPVEVGQRVVELAVGVGHDGLPTGDVVGTLTVGPGSGAGSASAPDPSGGVS